MTERIKRELVSYLRAKAAVLDNNNDPEAAEYAAAALEVSSR